MNPTVKYSAFIASLLLVMPYVVYADQGSISQHVSKRMQMQMVSLTCWNTLATGYLNDVVSEINNATITSTITHTDIPKLGSDFNSLQTDANSNNAPQFKTDTKTFRADTKTANFDIRSAIKAVHNKSVFSTLKLEMVQLKSTYKSCLFGVKQQHATFKVHIFKQSLSRVQNMTNKLSPHGADITALSQTINLASNQIQTFEAALDSAQNSTQLEAALDSFCLYNGCKDPNNFHFAAKTAIDANQAKLNVLATKNSTSSYQGLVNQAQTDLNNAQTILNQVGSNQYQGTQSSDVWSNIKSAADLIHQIQITNHKQ